MTQLRIQFHSPIYIVIMRNSRSLFIECKFQLYMYFFSALIFFYLLCCVGVCNVRDKKPHYIRSLQFRVLIISRSVEINDKPLSLFLSPLLALTIMTLRRGFINLVMIPSIRFFLLASPTEHQNSVRNNVLYLIKDGIVKSELQRK